MCGRYAMAMSNEELFDSLQQQLPRSFHGRPRWEREQDYRPNYNVAPRQRAPVVHRDDSGDPLVETMQWGLIPHWTKHPPTGPMNTINARSESLLDPSSGGMWHALKSYKRCVVPAQGYYEWQKRPSSKIAHFTRLPLGPKNDTTHPPLIFFAGLYDVVKYVSPVESKWTPREDDGDGDEGGKKQEAYPTGNPVPLATFTILTTTPAKDLEWLHDRMPCLLVGEEEVRRWLDLGEVRGWEEGKGGTGSLLKSTPGLDSYPVNPEVGKIGWKFNSVTYIQPVSERSDGIKSFLQKQSPVKAKKEPPATPPTKGVQGEKAKKEEVKKEQVKNEDAHKEEEGIKAEVGQGNEATGLGDDSNAPNPAGGSKPSVTDEKLEKKIGGDKKVKEEVKTPTKRRREDEAKAQPGRQTKVVRRTPSDEAKKGQASITSFFSSPTKAKAGEGKSKKGGAKSK